MNRTEKRLAAALQAIWEAAHAASEDVTIGCACFAQLAAVVQQIADLAAEATADLQCYCPDDCWNDAS